jgi:dTMP kinase
VVFLVFLDENNQHNLIFLFLIYMYNNLFIALEGIDGSGKSTQVKLLADRLTQAGHKVHTTFEPTDSTIGSMIRSVLKHESKADEPTIAALFAADRLDHLLNKKEGILKMLTEGFTVITDRFYFSSYAYHSVHVPIDWVIASNAYSASLRRPDINIYIDMDPEISMQRLAANRKSIELYETLDNLKKVKANYTTAFNLLQEKEHIAAVDGNSDVQTVSKNIWEQVAKLL